MEVRYRVQRLCHIQVRKMLLIISTVAAVIVLVPLFGIPYENHTPYSPLASKSEYMKGQAHTIEGVVNDSSTVNLDEDKRYVSTGEKEGKEYDIASDDYDNRGMENTFSVEQARNLPAVKNLNAESRTSIVSVVDNFASGHKGKQGVENEHVAMNKEFVETVFVNTDTNFLMDGKSLVKERRMKRTSMWDMKELLHQTTVSANSQRPRWTSARDRELQHARLQIENAPIIRNAAGLEASIFRNFSMFKRSYEMMERMLKVYIFKEGEKPIFHEPYLRGIYASEGWFMKLMEGNKQFAVKDPRKAHLFYLPFSSLKLRSALREQNFSSQSDLEKHLKNYVDVIARKYRFWNRTRGADHFLVACHDWAPRFTRKYMGNCIRVLCNSNIARGFKIGKDVSLPVTSIRSSQNPLKDLGGNSPSERPILAFFAGGLHGYLRPILLQYWSNKEPDMKILGPMARDLEGKARYREFMKSSKYCVCARGYEVHTPRVVESISYDCVPVIISDNYVPPFFEILDWDAFCVFVMEKDIPNLRNILLSIPEEKYLKMQRRVKLVQQHFLWHKKPEKYDLFHMILHSVWYYRLQQVIHR